MPALKHRAYGGNTYERHIGFSFYSGKKDFGMVYRSKRFDDSGGGFRNNPAPSCRNCNHHPRWMAAYFQWWRAPDVRVANPGNRRASFGAASGYSIPRWGGLSPDQSTPGGRASRARLGHLLVC